MFLFIQAVFVKYNTDLTLNGAALKKIVMGNNNVVYVLTDKGLYKISNNQLVKNALFTPLNNIVPVDEVTQEETRYLSEGKVLTNAYAGLPYADLPKDKYNKMAVDASGNILLAGENAVGLIDDIYLMEINVSGNDKLRNLYVHNSIFYALSTSTIYRFDANKFIALCAANDITALAFNKNEIVIATPNGCFGINAISWNKTFALQQKLPVAYITCIQIINGKLWVGTRQGAFIKKASGAYRYYASKRSLNEDDVTSVAADSKGNMYCLTPTGVNKINFQITTLLQKANYSQDKISQRHLRYGLVSEVFF
jgi:ligand-binding sensor domain-containing protein